MKEQEQKNYDIEAEMCVLGSMMLDANKIDTVLKIIDGDCFYREDHMKIFDVLYAMHHRGAPIDLVLVRDELIQRSDLVAVGGVDYLVALAENVPSAANAEHYAKIVRRHYYMRKHKSDHNGLVERWDLAGKYKFDFWHKLNLAIDANDRKEFNKWQSDLYGLIDEIRDDARRLSGLKENTPADRLLGKVNKLNNIICLIPVLME